MAMKKNIIVVLISLVAAGMLKANVLKINNKTRGPVVATTNYTVPAFCLTDKRTLATNESIELNTGACVVSQLRVDSGNLLSPINSDSFRPIDGRNVQVNVINKLPYKYAIEEVK